MNVRELHTEANRLRKVIADLEAGAEAHKGVNPLKGSRLRVKARMVESRMNRALEAISEGELAYAESHLERARELTRNLKP